MPEIATMTDHRRRLSILAEETGEIVTLTVPEREAIEAVLAAIQRTVELCQRYNSAAVNTGAHALAGKVLWELT